MTYFGAMLVVGYDNDEEIIDMSIELWEKVYEKFGGFENLKMQQKKMKRRKMN